MRKSLVIIGALAVCTVAHPLSARAESSSRSGFMSADRTNTTDTVREAMRHAQEAKAAGIEGNAGELVLHSRIALDKAKDAQRAGHNDRLNEGVQALGEAIERGKISRTQEATEYVARAILRLSQAAIQLQEGNARTQHHHRDIDRMLTGAVVRGEVLSIESDDLYISNMPSGKLLRLVTLPTMLEEIEIGDSIEANVFPDGRVIALKTIDGDESNSTP
ncbi:MAG: small metal-binding protein SmbP [Nitrospiraceae bacterium]